MIYLYFTAYRHGAYDVAMPTFTEAKNSFSYILINTSVIELPYEPTRVIICSVASFFLQTNELYANMFSQQYSIELDIIP